VSPMPGAPWRVLLATLTLLALLVGACTTTGGTPTAAPTAAPSAAPAASASPSPAPSASPSAAAVFPVTLTDDEGTPVEIPAEPQKIASLTPANTEILFAIGAGDRVVATDDGSDYPEEAKALPDVATFQSVDVEQIVAAGADLVVAGGLGFNPPDAIAQLRTLGIPVLVLYAPSVDSVYKDIELVGVATGQVAEAEALTESMHTEIEAISAAAAATGEKPRTFYEVGYTDATGEIFGPADQSFVAEMVTLAGADTITTGDPASYAIPLENLIEQDPEVIILGVNPFYAPTPEAVAARAGWDVMTAVKSNDIRTVEDTEITRPGPRLPSGLRKLTEAIDPEVALPPAP
jgi:iron complex transport system substrate-binding protein